MVVRPEGRRRGVGSALLTAAEERLAGLGVHRAYARVADEPAPLAFAERCGYRPGRRNVSLGLDLATATLPAAPALPAGVRLTTAADLPDPRCTRRPPSTMPATTRCGRSTGGSGTGGWPPSGATWAPSRSESRHEILHGQAFP
ncbi:N-acetyltransferase family protein [Micromonospora peucetia]|uniref:GNAT family N-acetyltransferase n=1 Tax=Micromonospora peucetia TaxID=47871 RepID=UPI003CCC11FB